MREPGIQAASKHSLRAAVVVTGLCGITAQILLVREFLVTFAGNELTIGVILANWLLAEAAGAVLAGGLGRRTGRSIGPYVAVQLVFALSLPGALFAVRALRSALGLTGESVGLAPVFWSSIVLLAPVSMSHGALFSLAVRMYSRLPGDGKGSGSNRPSAAAVGDVYLLETAGTIAGGALLSFFVLALLDALTSVIIASLAALAVCILLCWSSRARVLGAALGCVLVLGLAAALCGGEGWLYRASVRGQWPHLDVVSYSNSVYGNITVTRSGEQYSFFENGAPVITTPNPDIEFVEEFVHYPMLFHPAPRRVLVISGGAGGVLNEVQKYPVRTIDYCELDPALIEAVRRFPTPLTERELSDPRTRISNVDGRLFLSQAAERYDIILLGLPLPTDLQTGRFFTTDFFEIARNKLADGGILALSVPGSITYLDESLAAVNLSVLRGLQQTFPAVRVIASHTNFYLASKDRRILELGSEDLIGRMEGRGIAVRFLIPEEIRYWQDPKWVRSLESALRNVTAEAASDSHPVTVFYGLAYWNALYSPTAQRPLSSLGRVRLPFVSGVLAALVVLFLALRAASLGGAARAAVAASVFSSGLAAMILQLVLIFSYQVIYGYVYHQIALLVTAMMVGTAAGSMLMVRLLPRLRRGVYWLLGLEGTLAAFGALIPAAVLLLKPAVHLAAASVLLQAVYLALSAALGLLIGAQFPLCNGVYLRRSGNVGGTAGLLYGCDLMGGWMGGLLGGIVLVPVLGLWGACVGAIIVKVTSGMMVALSAKGL